MKCPKCNIDMSIGIAINPKNEYDCRYIVPQNVLLSAEQVKLIKVLKCHKCGYSDDGYSLIRQLKYELNIDLEKSKNLLYESNFNYEKAIELFILNKKV